MSRIEYLCSEFERIYGAPPDHIARAPGRVNLMGEHTDYNDGFVMPIAIDLHVLIAGRRRPDNLVKVTALDVPGGQTDVFSIDAIAHHPDYRWANYVRGVAYWLRQTHVPLVGMDAAIMATLPSGAGLGSSAALEVCAAVVLQNLANTELDRVTIAQLCRRAENDFVGVKTGIMDRYASALGEQGKALKVDCRELSYSTLSLPRGVTVVVADTNKKRPLAGSDYNTRRLECENAVMLLSQLLHRELKALRDVSVKDLNKVGSHLPENLWKRARHVVTENERVTKAAKAAQKNDAVRFGALMNESQTSLHDDYDASSPELDLMVEIARRQKGCLGSRLTGAGWGGATVNLVRDTHVNAFVENVAREYFSQTGIEGRVSPVRACKGADVIQSSELQ